MVGISNKTKQIQLDSVCDIVNERYNIFKEIPYLHLLCQNNALMLRLIPQIQITAIIIEFLVELELFQFVDTSSHAWSHGML